MHVQVVLAAVACPNLPVASILGIKTWIKDEPSSFSSNEIVEEPAGVYRPLEQSGAQHTTGCLFTALQGCGAFQADLFAKGENYYPAALVRLALFCIPLIFTYNQTSPPPPSLLPAHLCFVSFRLFPSHHTVSLHYQTCHSLYLFIFFPMTPW